MPEDLRNDCLSVMRTVMDFSFSEQFEDEFGVNQEFLTRKSKEYFWGSRKLLQDQAIEQIPEFSEHLRTSVKSFNFKKIEIEFTDNYRATVEPKIGGSGFGEVLSLKLGEETIVRYFIKGYTHYPIRNNIRGSEGIWSGGWMEYADENPLLPRYYRYPNIKDVLAYKLLESFGLGPHVEFVINPYLSRGFYIATQDLTHDDQTFMTLGQKTFWGSKMNINQMLLMDLCLHTEWSIEFKERITTMDVIGRIMCLSDLNIGNIGFILKGSNTYNSWDFFG